MPGGKDAAPKYFLKFKRDRVQLHGRESGLEPGARSRDWRNVADWFALSTLFQVRTEEPTTL